LRTLTYGHIAPGLVALLLVWPGAPTGALAAQGPAGTLVSWGQIVIPEVAPGTRFKAIAAGGDFSLALTEDGTVVACGWNENGEANLPGGLSGVIAIATGGSENYSSLALKQDGTVAELGPSGQLSVPSGLSNVTAIALGEAHGLALKKDGTVVAWGSDANAGGYNCGQATVPNGLTNVIAIAAGDYHSLALQQDGTVVAWGGNVDNAGAFKGQATVPAGLSNVIAIAAGANCSMAIKQDGTVTGWGDDSSGQLDVPDGLTDAVAVSVGVQNCLGLNRDGTVVGWAWSASTIPSGLTNVVAVAAGDFYDLALLQDGTIVGWGGNSADTYSIAANASVSGVVAVAAGPFHTLALKQDGTVLAWGSTFFGPVTVPSSVAAGGFTAVAAGTDHDLALKQDGTVVAWGSDWNETVSTWTGQYTYLGQSDVPAGLSGVVAIAAGPFYSMALTSAGEVVAWGEAPYVPAGLSNVTAIAAGGSHWLALMQDGTVSAWGDNGAGQATVPSGLTGVIAIAAGNAHSLALLEDGALVTWGDDSFGQAPGRIPAPAGRITAIAAGERHSLALLEDGTVVAWGDTYLASAPEAVPPGLGGVMAIAAGSARSLALIPTMVYPAPLAPVILVPPQAHAASAGSSVGLYVVAEAGTPLDYQWLFNGTNALSGANNSLLDLPNAQVSQSGAYSVVVANAFGAVTSPPAFLSVLGALPAISAPPLGQTAIAGSTPGFSVSASGSPPLAYQWFFDATNALAGATNSALDLMNVQFSQSGAYSVIVTNAFGAVTSSPAVLTVVAAVVWENTDAALRGALALGGVIPFACDGTITLTSQIVITNNTVLDATGHQITIAPMNPGPYGSTNRAFYVSSNVTFTAVNLAISNGCANALDPVDSSALRGGAILNDGVLNLRGVSFLNNSALHGGGAVANRAGGTVKATNCAFAGNSGGGPWPSYASPAYGGAILNEGGSISLQICLFHGNSAQGGSDFELGNGGGAGLGGAIHNEGNLSITGCTFRQNSASGGGGFTWVPADGLGPGVWGTPGGGAFGGAICNLGAMALSGSTVMSNSAAGAGGGSGSSGGVGFNYQPIPSGAGGNGSSGLGGGLFNGGTASAVNCTFYANIGTGGNGGHGGPAWTRLYQIDGQGEWYQAEGPAGPDGAGGSAGACLCSTNGGLSLTNCTVAFNTASAQADGAPLVGGVSATGALMVNTLLAANSPLACASSGIIDGGHNLNSDASCAFTDPTSLSNTDPRLGPLADNGGPTLTLALLPGSPAIGAADSASAPSTDQRGFPRPSGSADIGAYQFNTPLMLKAAQSAGGGLDLSVFGSPGQTCRLLASPDLVDWTAIATNSFGPSGFFLFHDPAGAGQTQRFYRAVMP